MSDTISTFCKSSSVRNVTYYINVSNKKRKTQEIVVLVVFLSPDFLNLKTIFEPQVAT